MSRLSQLTTGLLDALYPPRCVCAVCDEERTVGADVLCDDCRARLVRCPRPTVPEPLDGAAAAFLYDGLLHGPVHRFKYQRQSHLADFFAAHIELPPEWRIDCLVPVPLHPLKLWRRTFNQSALLADALSERYALPVRADWLRRTRNTPSQTELSAAARERNVRGAFSCAPLPAGLSVALVDDVTTTGATLCACAHALKKAGAERVYALVAACANQ